MARPTREALDVRPLTLAFRDAALERAYGAAWTASMLRPIRIAIAVFIANAAQSFFTNDLWLDDPVALRLLSILQGVALTTLLATLAATYWAPAATRLREVLLGVFLAGTPLLVVVGWALPPGAADRIGAVLMFMVMCTSTLLQVGFVRSAILGVGYAIALHVVLPRAVADPGHRVSDVLLFYLTAAVCLTASYVGERRDRRLFLDERLLAAERARSEDILKRELSHQVAERSRELGAVLAKSDVTLDVRRLSPGERFAERYKIVAALGAGGMGAVYEVERVTDGAKLALKAVVGEVSGASAARFAREAEIGARIRHPNLISIVDVGVSSGVPFLAMELVRGGSLEAQRAKFGDVAWALPILKQIAEGLAALHDAGVVHRDLKPANVLLADGGVAKISDFGISRFGALDEGASIDASADTMAASPKARSSELTGTGVVMGTPLYMAPEGAKSARALDASADVFAFGIIAYEMLTGRSPFPVPAFMLAMAEQAIPVPPAIVAAQVAPQLAATVIDCFATDPAKRPRVRAILAALG